MSTSIVSRIKFRDTGEQAYVVIMDGNRVIALRDGLYNSFIMDNLIACGYTYMDRFGKIFSPDGEEISKLPIVEDPISDDDFAFAYSDAEGARSEKECVPYFVAASSVPAIKFKDPTVEINTREEFVSYLRESIDFYNKYGYSKEVRPINSFVSKEALFTIRELITDNEVKEYFNFINKCKRFHSYHEYKQCIDFLMSEGVLSTDSPSEMEFLDAYYAWGICGIKTPCYNIKKTYDCAFDDFKYSNTQKSKNISCGLLGSDKTIYFRNRSEDMTIEPDNPDRHAIYPADNNEFSNFYRNRYNWSTEYKPVRVIYEDKHDRIDYKFTDEDDFNYTIRVSHNFFGVFNSTMLAYNQFGFGVRSIAGTYYPITLIRSREDYTILNSIIAKCQDVYRSVTKDCPVSSSYEICRQAGLNPESSVKWLARMIKENNFGRATTGEYGKSADYYDAIDCYLEGPSSDLVTLYNPDDIQYDSIEELIDILCETRDTVRESQGSDFDTASKNYSKTKDISTIAQKNKLKEKALLDVELDKLQFVKECFDNNVYLENFGDGKRADAISGLEVAVDLLLTVINVKGYSDFDSKRDFITDLEGGKIISTEDFFTPRNNAYNGYRRDLSYLLGKRAYESIGIIYVTKVFREMSNAPISEQRHYAFECIYINVNAKEAPKNRQVQDDLVTAIRKAADSLDASKEQCKFISNCAFDIANRVFVGILMNTIPVTNTDGHGSVIITVKAFDGYQFDVAVPQGIVNYIKSIDISDCVRYSTLYDFVSCELSSNSMFAYHVINADINPWKVNALPGFNIRVYNYAANYSPDEWLQPLGDKFWSLVEQTNGRPCYPIHKLWKHRNILSYDQSLLEINSYIEWDASNVDLLLTDEYIETMELYRTRFTALNTAAKKQGKYLQSMRLKSDVNKANLAYVCQEEVLLDDVYGDYAAEPKNSTNYLKSLEVTSLVYDSTKLISQRESFVSDFDIMDNTFYEIMSWKGLLDGSFVPKYNMSIQFDTLYLFTPNGIKKQVLSHMDKEKCMVFVNKNIFYQLDANRFLIRTISRDYVLEV